MNRIIFHADLDAFYASAEQLRNPELEGKPVAILIYSGREGDSGAVSTANYIARDLGIDSAMPIKKAKQVAEEADREVIFLEADIDYYRQLSEKIMEIFYEHADAMEKLSIDEAYLDLTEKSEGRWEKAREIASGIKEKVKEETGLTCSVGIAPNKLIAKMASGEEKPDGLTVIKDSQVEDFLTGRPVEDLYGVGEKTASVLEQMGIQTIDDLAKVNVERLKEKFGSKAGRQLHEKALGVDDSPVEEKKPKQLSRIQTLKKDSSDPGKIAPILKELASDLEKRLEKEGASFRTVSIITVSAKDYQMRTRSRTIPETRDMEDALSVAKDLLNDFLEENPGNLRRIGLRVSNLKHGSLQKTLLDY